MKSSRWLSSIVVVSLLALILSSCGDDSGTVSPGPTGGTPSATTPATTPPPATTPAPDAILKSMSTASAAMNSFESKMNMVMDMGFLGTTIKIDMSMTITADVAAKKMFMDMIGNTSGMGESAATAQQIYLIGDTIYMKSADAQSGLNPNTWYKQVLPAAEQQEMWTTQDVGDQFQILLDMAAAQVLGSEVINGVDCYKLKVTPTAEKLLAYLAASGSDVADMGIANPAQAFKQFDVTFWVNKSNYLPAKMDMTMAIDAQGMVLNMTINATYDRVNQPVTITLPAAAQSATPLPQ